ncbi:hypothetical protein CRYUN_Cryun08bG0100800 [Craigia yunnanensis]
MEAGYIPDLVVFYMILHDFAMFVSKIYLREVSLRDKNRASEMFSMKDKLKRSPIIKTKAGNDSQLRGTCIDIVSAMEIKKH